MSRRRAREAALMVLFQVDVGGAVPEEALERTLAEWRLGNASREFATSLVLGTLAYRPQIDRVIEELSQRWRLERMNRVDRNVMRLALYELLFRQDIPPAVAINEAVELAKRYGGEESPRFVNGILGKVAENLSLYREKVIDPTAEAGGLSSKLQP
ncbi:NusB antitermination factor [Ammonifex degensii KC4]|uniref:Transcription antitermination protein NusB n=1 Tax=Ammonifex degensii (strain DSM 10501 / KC4) TaxID=429009 RepID=C9R7W0_AMMDK|nr:transcription antitermination factor NusB [Ammonifex degensii]ACX52389.1 NusB antitermination factor [Ammonifex degensii KC4]